MLAEKDVFASCKRRNSRHELTSGTASAVVGEEKSEQRRQAPATTREATKTAGLGCLFSFSLPSPSSSSRKAERKRKYEQGLPEKTEDGGHVIQVNFLSRGLKKEGFSEVTEPENTKRVECVCVFPLAAPPYSTGYLVPLYGRQHEEQT